MCLYTKHLATLLFILQETEPKKTLNDLQGNQNTFGPNQSEMLIFPIWTTATAKYLLFVIMQASLMLSFYCEIYGHACICMSKVPEIMTIVS